MSRIRVQFASGKIKSVPRRHAALLVHLGRARYAMDDVTEAAPAAEEAQVEAAAPEPEPVEQEEAEEEKPRRRRYRRRDMKAEA